MSRADLAKFGLLYLLSAILPGALWGLTDTWARWLAFPFVVLMIGTGLDLWLRLLPVSRTRQILRNVVSFPVGAVMLVITLGGALYNIVLSLGILYLITLVSIAVASRVSLPAISVGPAHFYIALLITVTITAYSQSHMLLPIKFMYYVSRGPGDKIAEEVLRTSAGLLHLINFRRLGYQLAFVTYVGSVVLKLSQVKLLPQWELITNVALESLLGFLAIDAYVSAFHPRLLKPRKPIRYTFRNRGNRVTTPTQPSSVE